jgi:hypothetical protein
MSLAAGLIVMIPMENLIKIHQDILISGELNISKTKKYSIVPEVLKILNDNSKLGQLEGVAAEGVAAEGSRRKGSRRKGSRRKGSRRKGSRRKGLEGGAGHDLYSPHRRNRSPARVREPVREPVRDLAASNEVFKTVVTMFVTGTAGLFWQWLFSKSPQSRTTFTQGANQNDRLVKDITSMLKDAAGNVLENGPNRLTELAEAIAKVTESEMSADKAFSDRQQQQQQFNWDKMADERSLSYFGNILFMIFMFVLAIGMAYKLFIPTTFIEGSQTITQLPSIMDSYLHKNTISQRDRD